MRNKRDAIRFLRDYIHLKVGRVKAILFKEAIVILRKVGVEEGLEEDDMNVCIAFIMKDFVGIGMKKQLLECMFPVTIVETSATDNIARWVISQFHGVQTTAVYRAIEWLNALVELGLTDPASVDGYYPLFFRMLRIRKLIRPVCKSLYLLTRPEDVNRWRVEQVLKQQKIFGPKHYITAVLSLFKTYRPEVVPEKVPALSMALAFGKLPAKLNEGMEAAVARKRDAGIVDPWLVKIKWNIAQAWKAAATKEAALIPAISYIHFEAMQYRQDEKRSVVEFRTIQELCSHQLTLDIPCNVMSLLYTHEGRHVIAFADSAVQSRFSYSLYYTLYNVFLTRERKAAEAEKEDLLHHVWELEQYMLQGIPVVSRFLALYINLWDGNEFFEKVLHLLEWITFYSYAELFEIILINLKTVFLVSETEQKCAIIKMLGRMLQNLVVVRLYSMRKKFTPAFIGADDVEDGPQAAQKLSQFISNLCVLGLLRTRREDVKSALLLEEALGFYEVITDIELRSRLPLWTILSPLVMYKCLFSRSAVLISRICSLMLRYKQETRPHLKRLGFLGGFVEEEDMVNRYVNDLGSCLWTGKGFAYADQGYIFGKMDLVKLDKFLVNFNIEQAYTLVSHIAFAPYIKEYIRRKAEERSRLSKMDALAIIGDEFPSIGKFLEAYLEHFQPIPPSDE